MTFKPYNSEQYLFDWAKANRKRLCKEFFQQRLLSPTTEKIAVFMAGSPGAGKTEFISRLLTKDQESSYYILDLDEIRKWMPDYTGSRADIYAKGAIKIMEMMIDICNDKEYNFILDGTFTSTEVIGRNIERLLSKGYQINVFYIHTQPYIAWIYSLIRECDDGRHVPSSRFIRDYYLARENVLIKKKHHGEGINVYVGDKRFSASSGKIEINLYNALSYNELVKILDKSARLIYNVGNTTGEKLYFATTSAMSQIPFIGKYLLKWLVTESAQKRVR